ncbi:DUF3861 domain-containing protein [Echinimonas agarilytica]|uniref:DUF3861 domain-containing protein n=1 Tax=Echinimonas agarilytica TaxID=1215918 RepID=A0AA41W728_9GAMM|nr:DUF3861 domain-containing protein [Echinimonas agarilytica]MCM2680307.1 DUF3861 domain-containing protein [Echinimonas agarilytica]
MNAQSKRMNTYQITIEKTNLNDGESAQTLQFEALDREDMFTLIEKLKQTSGLDAQTSTQVGVALRLLGPMMMAHRKHPVFVEFMPHFKAFMLNLKAIVKGQKPQ